MTEMGLQYMANIEQARHNSAVEQENARSNRANEEIGRTNAAANTSNAKTNLKNAKTNAKQLKINRKNAKSQAKQAKAAMVSAKASRTHAKAAMKQAKTGEKAQKEQVRTNKKNEALKASNINVQYSLGSDANAILREKNAISKMLGKKGLANEAKRIKYNYTLGKGNLKMQDKKRETDYKAAKLKDLGETKRAYMKINADRARSREKIKSTEKIASKQRKLDKWVAEGKNAVNYTTTKMKGEYDVLGKGVGAVSKGIAAGLK